MSQKINRCLIICVWLLIIGLLVYSRFVNLDWGLPYPMHPDERNMANAIQGLKCVISNFEFRISNFRGCGNPHFFAYGQFPLYLGYVIVFLLKFFDGDLRMPISYQEAVISLRIISAIASIINVFILVKIIELIMKKPRSLSAGWRIGMTIGVLIFSPYAIQFAHFGTTESLLMLFYSLIVYYSLKLLDSNGRSLDSLRLLGMTAIICGLALATKVSSVIFLVVPVIMIVNESFRAKSRNLFKRSIDSLRLLGMTFLGVVFFFILFSPHNLINYQDFVSSFRYESAVATGQIKVFYTRQFEGTIAYLFQAIKVFPYALGWPVYILGLLGFIFLPWKNKRLNLIRLAVLIYFIPSGYIFTKWSRFMAPILPLMSVFAILFIQNIVHRLDRKIWIPAFAGMTLLLIISGINYLRIYQKPDVRFQATDWINKNIPVNSYVLSETANVVDVPLINEKNLNVISFNFYEIDNDLNLNEELKNHLIRADYIFVPSRRIFANHPKQKYPKLNKYYEDLFNGKLGFQKVAEFSAGLNDEMAEETWSVFDHPTIRIYKRNSL